MQLILPYINGIALMALCAVLYGVILRSSMAEVLKAALAGLVLGVGAVVSMQSPIEVAPGVILDPRNLFVGMSGAFLGALGGIVTLIPVAIMRYTTGGIGLESGLMGMTIALCMGLVWRMLVARFENRSVPALALLGVMISASLSAVVLLPAEIRWMALRGFAGYVLFFNVVGAVLLGIFVERERRRALRETYLSQQAGTDPLTGLANRRAFEQSFPGLTQVSTHKGVALLLADLDHFKLVNDTHGHHVGDEVLRAAAERLNGAVRQGDMVARIGGEEFAIVLPHTNMHEANRIAERLRKAVGGTPIGCGAGLLDVTVSIGGAWSPRGVPMVDSYHAADAALYQAKDAGRDRVVISELARLPIRTGAAAVVEQLPAKVLRKDGGPSRGRRDSDNIS